MVSPPIIDNKQWYDTQQEALEHTEGSVLVKWGNFHFATFNDQDMFLDYINETAEEDRCYFEVLQQGAPQRMFADIDGEGLNITKVELVNQWSDMMSSIFNELGLIFNIREVKWLVSSGEKISFHWSYTGCIFESCDQQKVFWKYVEHVIETRYPSLCFLRTRADSKMELMTVLDISVYSKNRPMRTIYSHKTGSDRVLMPCRMRDDDISIIRHPSAIEYLIQTDSTEFCNIQIPEYNTLPKKFMTRADIESIITQQVPNTEVYEVVGRIFKLRNVGTRICIIHGEENTTDNSYVIWRRDGLYFGCHDSGCDGHLKQIHKQSITQAIANSFDMSITNTYTFQSFYNQYNESSYPTYEALASCINQAFHRVVARVLYSEGTYIKKTTDGFDMVKKLGQSDFTMYYMDGTRKKITLSQYLARLNAFETYDCRLDPAECRPTDFNIWNGFQATRVDLNNISDTTREGFEAMKLFLLEIWANNDQTVYKYIISWMAGLFTNLRSINMVALAMVSKQGTGKGFFLQFLKLLLRGNNVCESQGIGSITQKHNTAIQNKRLVVINEMSSTREEFKANFDKIKTYISDPVVQIEPKGINSYQINNIANFILFTNHRDAIIIEESDRRYAVFEMADTYRNNTQYFANLVSLCFNQDVANAFYTYLLDFDAVSVRTIPDSSLRHEMMALSKSTPLKFLDAVQEQDMFEDETEVSGMSLYRKYVEWCSDVGERSTSMTKFGTVVSTVLPKRRATDGIYYTLPTVADS